MERYIYIYIYLSYNYEVAEATATNTQTLLWVALKVHEKNHAFSRKFKKVKDASSTFLSFQNYIFLKQNVKNNNNNNFYLIFFSFWLNNFYLI